MATASSRPIRPPASSPSSQVSRTVCAVRTLALDPQTGEIRLSGGRPVLVSGADAVAQRLRVRLKLWRGEWLLDANVGFPWRSILGEKGTERLLEVMLRRAITECPGVRSLDRFALSVNANTRVATCAFTVTTITGEPVTIEDFTVDPAALAAGDA